ncbi:MAG: TonB-dependent receptor [Deltaproteobacteria bacterium]|nr:TonB-dependent receptor [Deltaproteobacteria bacterium]
MKKLLVVCALLAVLFLPGLSKAQEEQEKIHELEEVVVTATRSAKSADEVFADVEIITQEDIKNSSASNVDDILRRLGAVDIRRHSDMGITAPVQINIRGVAGAKRVLVMMDGVPLNSALTGFFQPNQIQLSSIERIEVVKGPFSSLYGSNAMGGVINIISKKRKTDGVDIVPMFKSGNYDFIETGASVLGRKGGFSYSLDGSYRTVDNHYRRDKQVKYAFNPTTGGFDKSYKDVSDNSDYDDTRFFARFNYDFSDVTGLTFTGSYTEADTEMGTTHYLPVERDVDTEKKLYFLNLNGHTTVLNSLNIDMRVFSNYDKSDSKCEHIIDNPAPFGPPFLFEYGDREYWGRDTGIQIKASMPLGNFNYLTAGVDSSFMSGYWKNSKEDGTVIDHTMDESLDNQAVYLQNETELFSSLIVTLGARYDMNSESEDSFSPKLGLLYKLNDRVNFRGSAGRAFRAPNLNELYTPTWMMIPGIPFESNPDLEPEIIWSYDLGTSIRLTDGIDFNLTVFYSKAKDLISTPITAGVMRYENIDEVETDGFEVGLEGKILPWLTGYVNYTYTHSVNKVEGRLGNRPLHQSNGGIRTVHELGTKTRLTASLDARYNGSMFFEDRMTGKKIDLDPFTVLDFNLRLDLFDRLGIKGAVTNITNEDYEIHGSNLGPERCYWVGVDYRF